MGEPGVYLDFDVPAEHQFIVENLESKAKGIELVAATPIAGDERTVRATVYVPEAAVDVFEKKIDAYASRETKTGKPRYQNLLARVNHIRLSTIRSLWTDEAPFPESDQPTWWEIWFRRNQYELVERQAQFGAELYGPKLEFPERVVRLAYASPAAIERMLIDSDAIAELRKPRGVTQFFLEMAPQDQMEWVRELLQRVDFPGDGAPAVCVMDTGVNEGHPLLAPIIDSADVQTCNPNWGTNDTEGHGTQMAGLAAYGDLAPALATGTRLAISHRLESVKLYPPNPAVNPSHLWGALTRDGVSLSEIQEPHRRRVVCLAGSGSAAATGRPSSWSSAIDQICYGEGETPRLMVLAAGNLDRPISPNDYLVRNDLERILDPGQAWNALTVGAFTEMCVIPDDGDFAGYTPVAGAGDLSPVSRTSVSWTRKGPWPIKPDLVMEGGNYAAQPGTQSADSPEELSLLTTYHDFQNRLFAAFGDTSAATALASRLSAQLMAARSDFWPETVRGLLVHSADWTDAMRRHFPEPLSQLDKRTILRRYGYGAGNPRRAIWSAANDVTMIMQDSLTPFNRVAYAVRNNELRLHNLPWPTELLEGLSDAQVELRVTLSYFIEPNPGERALTDRHTYPSFGLRFELKRSTETLEAFHRRVNAAAREEGDPGSGGGGTGEEWLLGPQLRNKGSVHSDRWQGTAAELAQRDALIVFPIGGWWKQNPGFQRWSRSVRYALIITIYTPVEIDIYTPIANIVRIPIQIDTG